jgi:branched-chain amino acid transport system substrate-binding protein
MKQRSSGCVFALLACVLFSWQAASQAQPARGDALVIGQVVGLTGPIAASVKEQRAGAQMVFDEINAAGGVAGKPIRLITQDDGFSPTRTVALTEALIKSDNPVALFMLRGTANIEATLPVIDAAGIALVAPSTGAGSLHQPALKHVFMLKTPFQTEVKKAMEHLATIGVTRVAMVHPQDSFGRDASTALNENAAARKMQVLSMQPFKRPLTDVSAMVAELVKVQPQAVFAIGAQDEMIRLIKESRKEGLRTQFLTLSNNSSKAFVQGLGADGVGVVVTQTVPSKVAGKFSVVDDFQKMALRAKIDPSDAAMEGYLAARLMVEALRRAGKDANRERVLNALNSMSKLDFGGLSLGYSPTDHTGLEYVEMSIINDKGRFVR